MFINNLYHKGKFKNVWIFAFVVSTVPLLFVLSSYLVSNYEGIFQYSYRRLLAIISATIWTYIGPVMIIKWSSEYNDLFEKINEHYSDKASFKKQNLLEIKLDKKIKIISVVWTISVPVTLVFFSSEETLKQYYFNGYGDYKYWLFILCIAYIWMI